MDKIILCFDLNNCQREFSDLMQIVQAVEEENNAIDYKAILNRMPIRYCWIKEDVPMQYSTKQVVQNIEERWYKNPKEQKNIWNAHDLTDLEGMISKKKEYQFSYYIRIKNKVDEDLKNIQYLILLMQQFSLEGRMLVFLEPFRNYLLADRKMWSGVSLYHKFSHYMRFVLGRYKDIFYSAFFETKKGCSQIAPLSLKKVGIQSKFFPLLEVDEGMHTIFTRYCDLDLDGRLIENGEKYEDSRLKDLLEISKKILDLRIEKEEKAKKVRESIALNIYQNLSLESITVLEYAILSIMLPISAELTKKDIENYRKKVESINSGLIQIIENIFLHSYNRKGVFSFRIVREGKRYLANNILDDEFDNDLDRVLEIDIADANIHETIIDNFLNKLNNKERYFSDINLSLAHFFQKFRSKGEEESWKKYRKENPIKCLGLTRLAQELRNCDAILQVRSSVSYSGGHSSLYYKENDFNSAGFKTDAKEAFIPGTQFQIVFPELSSDNRKQHNANILLNGFGDFVEIDKSYARFVNYKTESFNSYAKNRLSLEEHTNDGLIITELDRIFYERVQQSDFEENIKDKMVCMWKNELDCWNKTIRPKQNKVYYLDLCNIRNMKSPWGIEVLCKAIVDSDILHSGKVIYFALINCNNGLIQILFDTIMISEKKLNDNLQIYLHADNGLDDLVISGGNQQSIIRNALQYCYLKESTLVFLKEYAKRMQGNEYQSNKKRELFPFDVLLCQTESKMTLFEQYIEMISQNSLTTIDGAGYLLSDTHMRLGNKVHLKEFYEISILFRKLRIARKIALLIIRRMIAEGVRLNGNFLFYGYASYSRAILTTLSEIVKCYQKKEYFVGFAVYQNDIMIQRTLTHISPNVQMYFNEKIPANMNVKIVQIVPIISTLTTFKKMWDMFNETYTEKKKMNNLIKNYTLFWVRDLQKKENESFPTEIEHEYWERIEGDRRIKTSLIKPNPQFFCCKKIQWFNPLNCKQCYPANVVDEIALVETDVTSTVPSLQLDLSMPKQTEKVESEKQIVNEIRIINLKDCVYYGHISRDGNHFQYYIDTTQYFHSQKKNIAEWLGNLQKKQNNKSKLKVLNIIVTPQHHTNVEFGHYVNNCFFNGNADFITIDSTKEYRSNIIAKYADVRAAIIVATELGIAVKFSYVDDTIITGTTYRRVNNLLHSLLPEEIRCPIQFDHVFVLVNRMSLYSKMDYVKNVEEDFHSFVDISISSVRNFGDSCAMCTLQKNSELFFKRSSTAVISRYWDKKQYDYRVISFDKYPQMKDCNQKSEQGYLRMLCSHYAKEYLDISSNLIESILGIVRLMSQTIKIEQRELEEEKAVPAENEENINYFKSESLSPIYCCVFRKDALTAIKSYLKILCRPFFSYGKVYRQAILDFFLVLTESFLNPEFNQKLKDENAVISNVKNYLNNAALKKEVSYLYDFLQDKILPEQRIEFIQEYLMEGLVDLRSNYIIRFTTLNYFKELISGNPVQYGGYLKYEKMIHRLINSNADETKSLWIEYLLITGRENSTNLNEVQMIRTHKMEEKEEKFNLFWDSLLIENTRLYYDSMLNFVQRASDFVENRKEDAEIAIRKSVESLWSDYYIKNLRRFVKLEILVDSKKENVSKEKIEEEIKERVIETANLLYLLKRETSKGIDRYEELKECIENLLYKGDKIMILTSAFAGAKDSDELYAVTDYKKGSVSVTVVKRVRKAMENELFKNKSYYIGKDYIVLCISNNGEYLRKEGIENSSLIKIQPLYFYIECNTDYHLQAILRIRKILMYRHQMLHWIEADFNNNAMPILAEQMGINRQLMRERAGDHNTNTDILTIEKLLQSKDKEEYSEIYQWLLLKVYVNMRIARLFRCEWGEPYEKIRDEVYTLKKNEDKINRALRNIGSSLFDETLIGLSPKNYFRLVENIFCFDVEIYGERQKNVKASDLRKVLKKLRGRCEEKYYYKQEYIICIIFDILFTAMKVCRNWQIDIYRFFREKGKEVVDSIFWENETIAQYYILKNEKEKCRITIGKENIPNKKVAYLILKNKVYGVSEVQISQKNEEFERKLEVKETVGMSVQAMKWYTETLGGRNDIKAEFKYEWNREKKETEFVIKLPILLKEDSKSEN